MRSLRKQILRTILVAASCLALPHVSAKTYPEKAVSLVVPYAPGGIVDTVGRGLAEQLSRRWHQPVVVINKPGASEIIGAAYVAKEQPDGYTLLLASEMALLTNDLLYDKLQYDPISDFSPILRLMEGPGIIVNSAKSPIKTLPDLLREAEKGNKAYSYGSVGVGSNVHLLFSWLANEYKRDFLHVPYKGTMPAVQDIMAGNIDLTFAPFSVVEPFIKTGHLHGLAATSRERFETLPNIPTVAEAGFPDLEYSFLISLVGPKGLPEDVIQEVTTAVQSVVQSDSFERDFIKKFGFIPIGDDPETFRQYLTQDREKQKARVKAANISLDP